MTTEPIKFVYYIADGKITDFSYAYNGDVGFDVDVADDVKAAVLNPDGTRNMQPNFAVLQDAYGNFTGAIRFNEAPVSGALVYIYRETPRTQDSQYETSSGFDAKSIEKNLDKITKILQEIDSHSKNKTVQLDTFQKERIKLELLSAVNNGQYLILDTINWVIKAGLFLEVTSDNRFRVSKDGKVWIYLPKSENIQEVRQREYLDDKSIRHLVFEYRVGSEWYDVLAGVSHTGLLYRDAEDSHPISAISGLQEKLTTIDENIDKKLDINQGTENVGKVLKVDVDGNIIASSEAAGLASVNHDETMEGAGTGLSPLKISETVLSEIAGKQPAGDYATSEELTQGLAEKANTSEVVDLGSQQTITGQKEFKGDETKRPSITATNIDRDVNPSSSQYASWLIKDKNGKQIANFYVMQESNGNIEVSMIATNRIAGDAAIRVAKNAEGEYKTQAPTPPTSDNSTQIATTAFVNNLLNNGFVTEYQMPSSENSNKGFFRFANGLLVQFGGTGEAAYTQDKTITFPRPYANSDYALISVGFYISTAGAQDAYNKNTTSFSTRSTSHVSSTGGWLAIGQGA